MSKGFTTVTEQVAQALRDGLRHGRWQGTMPGRNRLAAELGVNHKTVKTALGILEREGLLEAHGSGRKRRRNGVWKNRHLQIFLRSLRLPSVTSVSTK